MEKKKIINMNCNLHWAYSYYLVHTHRTIRKKNYRDELFKLTFCQIFPYFSKVFPLLRKL